LQYESGLSPGTGSPSPRGFCPPKENDKPSEATRELKSSVIRLSENLIVIWPLLGLVELLLMERRRRRRNLEIDD